MSKRDIYTVKYTAVVTGHATHSIPEGDKISLDGYAKVEWDVSTVRDLEAHEAEFSHSEDDGDDPCGEDTDCEWDAGCEGDGSCCEGACMEEQDDESDWGDFREKSEYMPGDLVLTVYRPVEGHEDPMFITVSVVAGDAPWATCRCGRVVTGPPNSEFILPCCGVSEGTLPWNDGNYWVLDSFDEDGNPVTLTPPEYRDMLVTAADTSPAMQVL